MAKAACKGNARLVIEALGDGVGELTFGAEIIHERFIVGAEHAGCIYCR